MNIPLLALAAVLAPSFALAGQDVRFDSRLSARVGAMTIEIKPSHSDPYTWEIAEIRDCPSYPCKPSDFTSVRSVKPVLVEDTLATDGPRIIDLGAGLTLVESPIGFMPPADRPDTPYALKLNGQVYKAYRREGFKAR